MKNQSILGLCLSASLLLAGPAAMADKNKDEDKPKNARAVQVQLDKKTGKKLSAPDDSNLDAVSAEAESTVDLSGMMPVRTEPPQYHADGTISMKMGTEHLKYLVMIVDEDGEKTLVHQKTDQVDLQATKDKGEK